MRLLLLALAACSYESPRELGPGDGPERDGPAADGAIDAPIIDGPHLLITEIFAEGSTDEFVEIFNPSQSAVPLGTFHLTDVANYWALPQGPIVTITSDFLARFPAGSEIAAGGLILVAVDGPQFQARFGQTPTYTIRTPLSGSTPMIPINALSGSIGAISDDGEPIVLFEWDGQRDLVRDVDIVVHGMPLVGNQLTAKQPTDGPDDNTEATAYAPDSNIQMTMSSRTADGGDDSYQRLTIEETETTGGNGISGHDETSELLDTTWSSTSVANPGAFSF